MLLCRLWTADCPPERTLPVRSDGPARLGQAGVRYGRAETGAGRWGSALAYTIREAEKAREEGTEKTILVNLSGHGNMDLLSYRKYFANELSNLKLDEEYLQKSKDSYKDFPKPEIINNLDSSGK